MSGRIGAVAVAMLFASACKPPETQVNGDVFIVTKGRQNVKLGLVEVAFVREAEMAPFIKNKVEAARAHIVAAQPSVDAARAELDRARQAAASYKPEYDKTQANLSRLHASAWLNYYDRVAKPASNKYGSLLEAITKKQEALDAAKLEALKFTRSDQLIRGVPSPVITAKTDADGKFTVKLPPGKYAVVATASRFVGGKYKDTEEYHWMVWLPLNGEKEKRIMLSSDNEDAGCPECVFKPSDFEPTVARPSETAAR